MFHCLYSQVNNLVVIVTLDQIKKNRTISIHFHSNFHPNKCTKSKSTPLKKIIMPIHFLRYSV